MFAALHRRLCAAGGGGCCAASRRSRSRCIRGRRCRTARVAGRHLPARLEGMVEAALQGAYPNCRVRDSGSTVGAAPCVVRLKKHAPFIKRVKALDRFEQQREPPMNRLLTVMGACGEPAFVQLAMTPAPAVFRGVRQARVQAPRGAPGSRAQDASGRARPLDGRGRRAARRPRGPAQAAVLRRSARGRRRARRSASGSPRSCASTAPRTGWSNAEPQSATACSASTRRASSAARATRCRRSARACSRRPSSRPSGSCRRSTTSPSRSRARRCRWRPRRLGSCARGTGPARCATPAERSRSTRSCASRTPPCRAPSSRASRATSSRPSPRIFGASAAR